MIKRISFSALILLIVATLSVLGCGPGSYPPNNRAMNPVLVFDGMGNIITAYQINIGEGPETSIKKIDQNGKVLWNVALDTRQPEPQTRTDPKASFTELISDGNGNTFITWDYDYQIYVKMLDNNGKSVWEESVKIGDTGKYLQRKTFYDVNKVVVIWIDPDYNLNLQKIDNDGNLIIADSKYIENVSGFEAIRDNTGDICIVWGQLFDDKQYLNKVNTQGQFEWSQPLELDAGLITTTKSLYSGFSYWLINDGSGNVIVGWINNWKRDNISLKKVDATGNVMWAVDKDINENSYDYRVIDDQNEGVFVFWNYGKSIFAQHIDSNGMAVWDENGVIVIPDHGLGVVDISTDNLGGTIIIWNYDLNPDYAFYAQRIDSSGTKLWDGDKIQISTPFGSYMNGSYHITRHIPMIYSDGNSYFVSYGVLNANHTDSYIQKIEKDGTLPWGINGLQIGL
jgi:hypothetical protein